MFTNGQQNVKIANVFFHMNFPLYGNWLDNIWHTYIDMVVFTTSYHIVDIKMEDTVGVVTLGMPCKFYIHKKNILNLDFGKIYNYKLYKYMYYDG